MRTLAILAMLLFARSALANDAQAWLSGKTETSIEKISICSFVEARIGDSILSYHSEILSLYKFQCCSVGCSLREVFSSSWHREDRYAVFGIPSVTVDCFEFKLRCMFEYSTFDTKPDRIRHRFRLSAAYKHKPLSMSTSAEIFITDRINNSRFIANAQLLIFKNISIELLIGIETNHIGNNSFFIGGMSILVR